jgi:hypothetical protein
MSTSEKAGTALRSEDEEARRQAASLLGSARTERKAASSRENGKLGGRNLKPLAAIECTCGGGDTLNHKTTCPRGRVIRYRQKNGLPMT